MSDTPKTNNAFCETLRTDNAEYINIRFARELERDLMRATKERDSWKAKAEANERDAGRYQWLVWHLSSFHAILFDGATPLMYRGRYLKTPDEINAAIDAARSAENVHPKEPL